MGISDEQLLAINAERQNMLVSAAAGSGKTTCLVARITKRIIEKKISVDRILVVTFTVDAADNMKKKLEKSLRESISKSDKTDLDNIRNLERQLDLLPNSYIQTMSSFCTRVIREKGHSLKDKEMPEPGLSVLSDSELMVLMKKSAQEAIDNAYLRLIPNGSDEAVEEGNSSFVSLTRFFGDGRNDKALVEKLVSVYMQLRSLPDYNNIIDSFVQKREQDDASIKYIGVINDKLSELVTGVKNAAEELIANEEWKTICFLKSGNKKRIDDFLDLFILLIDASNNIMNGDSDNLFECFMKEINPEIWNSVSFPGLPKLELEDDVLIKFANTFAPIALFAKFIIKHSLKRMPNNYNASISGGSIEIDDELFELILRGPERIHNEQLQSTGYIKAFVQLLHEMDIIYAKNKKRIHGMDFPDQEHEALRILKSGEVAGFYKSRFDEIYVDEYQDNSTIQDTIISKIANDNVFMVGDVKQSIYKFRYANPSMFITRMNDYENKKGGHLYKLTGNYRCSIQIINVVNDVFSRILSEKATEVEYDEGQKLNAVDISKDGPLPEVVLINMNAEESDANDDTDVDSNVTSDDFDEEETVDSNEINASKAGVLLKVKKYIDEGTLPKDICVLTRRKSASAQIAKYFNDKGYPAKCVEDRKIFADNDIRGLCNLITVIANVYRDECLIGVLLSPYAFSNFTLDEIGSITAFSARKGLLKQNLFVKLCCYAKSSDSSLDLDESLKIRVAEFVRVIDDFRAQSVLLNISELVESIFTKTGIRATLKANGVYSELKLSAFKDWLCSNYLKRAHDVSSVARDLDDMKLKLGTKASMTIEDPNDNRITCMTIHKSKGLERKCVIVTDLNLSIKNGKVSSLGFEEKDGFVTDAFNEENLWQGLTLEEYIFARNRKREEVSEEIRMLYVAMTRAMENLSFVLPCKCATKEMEEMISQMEKERDNLAFSASFIENRKKISHILLAALLKTSHSNEINQFLIGKTAITNNVVNCNCLKSDRFNCEFYTASEVICEANEVTVSACNSQLTSESSAKLFTDVIDENGTIKVEEYRFKDSVMAPSKTSVSELKAQEAKMFSSGSLETRKRNSEIIKALPINLIVPDYDFFNEDVTLTPAGKGTVVHGVLRYLDLILLSNNPTVEVLEAEISRLISQGTITNNEASVALEFSSNILAFASSKICQDLTKAESLGQAFFEKPVTMSCAINKESVSFDEITLIQGVIDAMYIDSEGKAVIIDYKTDIIDSDDVSEIVEIVKQRHAEQLMLYSAAIKLSGYDVNEGYIWLIRKNLPIKIF